MDCRITDMRSKEVINIADGERMGYIYDVMFSVDTGRITAVILPGKYKMFGIFGRGEDIVVPWKCIKKVSSDIVLIDLNVDADFKSVLKNL